MTKKDKRILISSCCLLAVVVITTIIITIILVIGENKDNNLSNEEKTTTQNVVNNDDYEEEASEEATTSKSEPEPEPEPEPQYNSLEKLAMAYEAEELDVNEYFAQLMYLAYADDRVDSKYVSDYEFYMSGCQLQLEEMYTQYKDVLDEDIKKFFLSKLLLSDVRIGNKTGEKANANRLSYQGSGAGVTTLDYKIQSVDNEQENAATHNLDKVYLSSNEHFLIWYTDKGDDAISSEQLYNIADILEKSINEYEEKFGIEYSYEPYVDNKLFNADYSHAEEVMGECGVSISHLDTAMSVYVYDTGSDGVLASYNDAHEVMKWINDLIITDYLDDDGIINYPYIVLNRKGFEGNIDSLTQLCNHELFHHMQFLYGMKTTGARCVTGNVIYETIANYASAIVSDVTSKDAFLNGWAGIYSTNTSTRLGDITDAEGTDGYGIFPYFYSYADEVPGAHSIIMEAHNDTDSLKYIQENTDMTYLIKTINNLAFRTISQNYDKKSFISNEGITEKDVLDFNNKYEKDIEPGAIDYYKLGQYMDVDVSSNGGNEVTFNIYGRSGDIWKEVEHGSVIMLIDTSSELYKEYDELYLAVTNGNLVASYEYDIEVKDIQYADNEDFVTSIDNYNMDVEMVMGLGGIETTTAISGIVDQKHQKQYLVTDVKTFGMTVATTTMYADFHSGYTYMTDPYSADQWWKEKGTSQMVDLMAILDQLTNMKDVEKIDGNHYKIKMSSSDVSGLMSGTEIDSSMIKGKIMVDAYVEDGYITKLEYDFSDLISGIDSLTATISFYNYGNAGDVNIPKSIVEGAKTR